MIITGYKLRLEEELSKYSDEQIKEFFKLFNIDVKYEFIFNNGYLKSSNRIYAPASNELKEEFTICVYFQSKSKSNFPMNCYTIKGSLTETFEKFQKYKELNTFI